MMGSKKTQKEKFQKNHSSKASPVLLTTACGRWTTTGIFPPGFRVEFADRGDGMDVVVVGSFDDLQPLKNAATHNTRSE